MNKEKYFVEKLLQWYQLHGRSLPWRDTTDTYHIVVSEVMSQQTQVARVIEKYHEWIEAFPTLESLAEASQADVLILWKGLGYNSRALRLQQLAKVLVKDYEGKFPQTYDELLKLPGIGPYTAGAVYVFGLKKSTSFVDTNIKRILHRVFDSHELFGWTRTDKEIAVLAKEIYPKQHAYNYHQALMDLGATICQARKPNCEHCPVQEVCITAKEIKANPMILKEKRTPYTTSREPFKETRRFLRGKVVDYLREHTRGDLEDICHYINGYYPDYDKEKLISVMSDLVKEGILNQRSDEYLL